VRDGRTGIDVTGDADDREDYPHPVRGSDRKRESGRQLAAKIVQVPEGRGVCRTNSRKVIGNQLFGSWRGFV
jgi:hypothetical protein